MITIKLAQLGTFKNGLNFSAEKVMSGCKMIGIPDFESRYIADIRNVKEVDNNIVSEEYLLKDGDILFVRSNGNSALVGRAMLIEHIKENVSFSGFCIRFRPHLSDVYPPYMLYLFKSPLFKKHFNKTKQTSISNLNQDTLGSIEIRLPDLNTQKKIASKLHSITQAIENNNQINDNLAYQSLMVA